MTLGDAEVDIGLLPATPPFEFARSLEFLAHFSPAAGEHTIRDGALTKALLLGGRAVGFRVEAADGIEEPALRYALYSEGPLTDDERRAALDRISSYLSLGDDLRPFYAVAREDERFAPVVDALYGYHQVRFLTPFENAAWAVLSQRTPPATARRAKLALTERFGDAIAVEGETYAAFPDPSSVAEAREDELLDLVRNARKAEYLGAVARAFADVDEAWLRSARYDEVEAWLRGIKGIGAWSAAFVLLRGLGRTERVPVGEARLLESARRVYGPDLSEEEVHRIAERYGTYQGYWAHYVRAST